MAVLHGGDHARLTATGGPAIVARELRRVQDDADMSGGDRLRAIAALSGAWSRALSLPCGPAERRCDSRQRQQQEPGKSYECAMSRGDGSADGTCMRAGTPMTATTIAILALPALALTVGF
ncbi:MAG TPA: hypothetical protein VLK59_10590 [Solirubrobacteraceae bacterium]|nr:hypothetical protein [Solirubrobacteraceae bacterium]